MFSFSFRKVNANIATKINIVLCMKEPEAPEVSCNPLKNNKKGIEPPNNPIKERLSQSFFDNCFIFLNCVAKIIIESKKSATIMFFENVNMKGFIPCTPNWFTKIETPEITAVKSTRMIPLLFIRFYKDLIYIKTLW